MKKKNITNAILFVIIFENNGGKDMSQKVSVVIEKDESGYYAYCPELEGCQTQGDSIEEVMTNIKEAIELYLETLSEEEIKEATSKEILTTTLEVRVA
jgi:predicted RNase H-like HicB family nuclease